MKNKIKKYLLFYLIEIFYLIGIVSYILYITNSLSVSTVYQDYLVLIFILSVIGISIFTGALFNKFINLIIVGLYSLYLISQKIYFRGFGSYYRLRTAIGLKDEIVGASSSARELMSLNDFYPIFLLCLLTILFYFIYFLFQKKLLKYRERILIKLSCLLTINPIITNYNHFTNQINETKNTEDLFQLYKTDYYIYESVSNVSVFVDKFGLVTLGFKDFSDIISNSNELSMYQENIDMYLKNKANAIAENEYTGLLKNKNILFVQAESFNEFGLDEDLTPTIWKLKHDGISVSRFNTPALSGSTSDSEFMANTSIVPNSDGEPVCYKYVNNSFPVTLPKLFKENGYMTIAVHNNYGSYYNRFNIFETLGYDSFYDCTELGLMDESDDLEVSNVLKYILADADYPLMMYWITYSGHQPYTLDSVGVEEENITKIKKKYPNLDEKYISYLAKNMNLDSAIKNIMEQAEYAGTLDNLVIVFFGDHIVKGMELHNCSDYFEETGIDYYSEFNNTDLFIYNTEISKAEYTKVSTLLDLLPTIANLYGFNYDEKSVLGRDIFDDSYDGFFFANYGEMATNNYQYNISKGEFYNTNGYDLTKAREEISSFEQLLDISKKILKTDYYKQKEAN